jgi:hypothetical protein
MTSMRMPRFTADAALKLTTVSRVAGAAMDRSSSAAVLPQLGVDGDGNCCCCPPGWACGCDWWGGFSGIGVLAGRM